MLPFITRWITYIKDKLHKPTYDKDKNDTSSKLVEVVHEQEDEFPQQVEPLYTQEQYELFENCKIGDMLWALMPLPQEQLDKVPKDHQIRPYLIVKKKKDGLLAYASTSTKPRGDASTYYCYHGYTHGTYKASYLKLQDFYTIPIQNLRSFMMHLQSNDLKEIEKRIWVNKQAGRTNLILMKLPMYIEKGDVISLPVDSHVHYYYIYQDDQQNLYGIYLIKGSQRDANYMIRLQKVPYVLDFNRKQVIPRKTNVRLLAILNTQQQEEIANIQKNLRYKRRNTNKCTKEVISTSQYTGCRYVDAEGDEFIFLYTWHDHRYGVCLSTFEQCPTIVRIKKNIPRLGKLKDEEVIAIIKILKANHADFHHQLDTTLALFDKNTKPA